jgi:light-regulated signal transduction histidine kinase (bacteriophytochrome)
MKAGALDYVLKPFKLSTIVPVLRRGLEVRQLRKEVSKLQHRVREHVVELEVANQELEAFSYTVSHDLRAPLRVISGVSTVLVQSYAPQLSNEAQQLVGKISHSANHMSQLIDHLLQFASLSRQPLAKQPVEVSAIVLDVLDMLYQSNINDRIKVVIGDLPATSADPMLLRQVYSNLLSNSFKFTRLKKDPQVEIGCKNDGAENIYFVRDNGAGFDISQADQLFKVFHRLHSKSQFEGTGVGLAFVHRIVQRHGGRIWVEAGINQGATFYFTLGLPPKA